MSLVPPPATWTAHRPGAYGWCPGSDFNPTARTFKKVVVLLHSGPTYLAGELAAYHPIHNNRQIWSVRIKFPVAPELFDTTVVLDDSQVWAVGSTVWNDMYAAQTHTFDPGMRTMMLHLEQRFSVICQEYGVSLELPTRLRKLAMEIGISAGHVAATTHLYPSPSPLGLFGKYSLEHFDHECKAEARKCAYAQSRQSMLVNQPQESAIGSSSTWMGPVSPHTSYAPTLTNASSTAVSHEGPTSPTYTTASSSRRTTLRESWVTTPSYRLQNTPKQIEQENSYFSEHSGTSEESPAEPTQADTKPKWWDSLKGWRGKK